MIITWNTPQDGQHNGTLACTNGHVHFRNVPPARKSEHDDAVRELSNALPADPGTVEQAVAFIKALGAKKFDLGAHTAFEPLPSDWKTKLDQAVAAIKGAPEPKAEPVNLEELVKANPELVKSVQDGLEKLGAKAPETPASTTTSTGSETGANATPTETAKTTQEEPAKGAKDGK